MQRPIVIPLVIVAAVVLLALAISLKRVSENAQALRIRDGEVAASFGPGWHIVPPFYGRFVKYPLGVAEVRAPEVGTFHAATRDGFRLTAALALRIEIRPQSAEFFYKTFGEDYRAGIESSMREIVEIVAARNSLTPGAPLPARFGEELIEEVTNKFIEAQTLVRAYRVEGWDVAGSGVPLAVDPQPLRKVVIVGVDGADWRVIDPLIAEGRLPNFAKLMREGASGPLRSTEPMLSPLLWTTMATGKPPQEHGILNFTVADPETGRKVPISRLYRKVDALWNMLSDFGRTVDVVGWLATFPAEAINGVMVTDRLGYLAYADAKEGEAPQRGSVSPEGRLAEISRLVVKSDQVRFDEFRRFADIDRAEFIESRAMDFDPKNPVNNMIMLYASTRTYEEVAEYLLRQSPDFLAVYFELVDATKHLFMHCAPPRQAHIEPSDYKRYSGAVAQAYVEQDRIIGELMALCDDNTVLIVVSDHGFKSGDSRPRQRPEIWAGKAAFWHLIDGIICMYGPGIRKNHKIEGASILDIAPTVLALQGLPKPADMRGHILEGALDPSLVTRLNRTPIATLQREREIDDLAMTADDATTEEALKKLEALGYITPENQDAHNNLGQIYQKEKRYREAIEEFEKALAINPNFPSALNNMGVCYGKLQEYEEAEDAFRRALELNPQDVFAMNNLAIMFMETRQFDSARQFAERAIAIEPNYANGHLTLGALYATIGQHELARAEFEEVLRIDPTNRNARANLERLRSVNKN